jgi:hypothetical protein
LDGRAHPKDIGPSFWGNSTDKREGDTLVIDSIGFKDKLTWLDDDAHPHSDAMHVVERWTRTDANHPAHSVTVEDPKFYTKPFTFSRVFIAMEPAKSSMRWLAMKTMSIATAVIWDMGRRRPSRPPDAPKNEFQNSGPVVTRARR